MSYQDRFAGVGRLYGPGALDVFRRSKIAVIGVGGVGAWAAEALARTGFGEIHLLDMDDICISNTNRQSHTLQSTVGQLKVDATAARLQDINPELVVKPIMDFLTPSNMTEYLTGMDYVVDAIDSPKVKAALAVWCRRNKVPLIMTGAAGGQTDPSQITVGDLNKTHNDPLAKKVRSILRREYGYSRNPKRNYSIHCVYSLEQLRYPQADGSVCMQKSFTDGPVKMDCSGGFGAATMVTAAFGFVAAARVADKLAKLAQVQAK